MEDAWLTLSLEFWTLAASRINSWKFVQKIRLLPHSTSVAETCVSLLFFCCWKSKPRYLDLLESFDSHVLMSQLPPLVAVMTRAGSFARRSWRRHTTGSAPRPTHFLCNACWMLYPRNKLRQPPSEAGHSLQFSANSQNAQSLLTPLYTVVALFLGADEHHLFFTLFTTVQSVILINGAVLTAKFMYCVGPDSSTLSYPWP
jgi:hypothetical protein